MILFKKKAVFFCVSMGIIFCACAQTNRLPSAKLPSFKKDTFNIIQYGAVADGITLNTKAINDAINACHQKGGGVVVIPGGLWLSGTLVLKSNVNLHLQQNALLEFTKDFDQYSLVKTYWEGVPQMRNQSPISAENETNIAITGSGIIDGNGDAWRMVKKSKLNSSQWKKLIGSGGVLNDKKDIWYPTEKSLKGAALKNPGYISPEKSEQFYDSIKDFLRPNMIVLTRCKQILLEGVTFQNSAAWNIHPLMCEDLTVRGIFAKNPWYAQNGDGIDVESCKNVLIENSSFNVGDDGICIKSGRDEAGRKRGMPSENILIQNCTVYNAHGGFVIGSEMSGGARNIYVRDCKFIGTDIGLRFKTTRGRGGVVENIFIDNIVMKDIGGEAILFDMYYAAVDPIVLAGEKRETPKVELLPVTEETPQFKNFYVNNVVCDGAEKALFIRGLPEMNIKNIFLKNLVIRSDKGIEISEAENISLSDVKVITKQADPVVDILNSKNISFENLHVNKNADLVFQIEGSRTHQISVAGSDFKNVKEVVKYSADVDKKVFTQK
jgi:polygalacturonase